jgi:hypothetical protein
MKKMKKFAAGGRFVDDGESQRYVEDAPADVPVAAPVAVGIEPRQLGPMSGGVGAGLGGIQDISGGRFEDTPAGARSLAMGPLAERVPMGQRMPPRGLSGAIGNGVGDLLAMKAAGMKKGGTVKKMAKGGSVSSASKRADGCAIKGKTKGRFV